MKEEDRQQLRDDTEKSQALEDWKDFMALIRAHGEVETHADKL